MTVGSFDPSAANTKLDVDMARELLGLLDGDDLAELDAEQASKYAPLVTHLQWAESAKQFSDAEVEKLIRIFTLGEEQHSAWAAEEKSAVIALVRELKTRGTYDKSLTRWIKSVSSNKFLPHGSLLDRL